MPTERTIQQVVMSVCSIPADFQRRGNVSVIRLLEDSGYRAFRDAIGVAEIQQHLQTHPDLIDDWSGYSSDKRCSSGWLFDDNRSSIRHYSSGKGRSREQTFGERSRACAEFIKRELDSILENTG